MAYRIDRDLEVDGGAKVSAAPSTEDGVVRVLELQAEATARSNADVALQANIDAHINDTTAAHAASAISVVPAGSIAATNVQAALEELDDECNSYSHIQSIVSDTWVVTHNLGRYPSAVAVIDSGGVQGYGAIVHDSINQLTISFGSAFSGRAEVR